MLWNCIFKKSTPPPPHTSVALDRCGGEQEMIIVSIYHFLGTGLWRKWASWEHFIAPLMKLFSIFWDWAFSGRSILSHVGMPTFWHKPPLFIYLKIKKKFYCWLCWVFIALCRLSLVAESGEYFWPQCLGFSLRGLLLLQSTGSRQTDFSICSVQAQ